MSFLDRFLGPSEGTPEYHYQQGHSAFWESGGFPEAINQFSLAIDLNSEFTDAYYFRGIAYTIGKEYDLAISDFTRVLELVPQSAGAEFWMSTASSEKQHEELSRKRQPTTEIGEKVEEDATHEIIENVLLFIDEVNDYRSKLLFKDLQSKELKKHENVFIGWHFDYAKPNAFSVTQHSTSDDLDKWISLGNRTTRMAWFYTVEGEREAHDLDVESLLHIEKYAQLINQAKSVGIGIRLVDEGSFYFLQSKLEGGLRLGNWSIVEFREKLASSLFHLMGQVADDGYTLHWYLVPTVGESVPPRSIGVDPDLLISESSVSLLVNMWISADDFALHKAQIQIAGELENKQPISFEIEQVFDDFNSGIRVLPPPEM
ncbi:MAG: tetratricopeptide repeat protein [Halioglobus sp.]